MISVGVIEMLQQFLRLLYFEIWFGLRKLTYWAYGLIIFGLSAGMTHAFAGAFTRLQLVVAGDSFFANSVSSI